jgi:predicted lipoprotein
MFLKTKYITLSGVIYLYFKLMNFESDGAFVYRDMEEKKLNLFIYTVAQADLTSKENTIPAAESTAENSTKYTVLIFRNGMTYTALSSSEGLQKFFEGEDMHCLRKNTFVDLEKLIESFTKDDYANIMSVVNSKIDLLPIKEK